MTDSYLLAAGVSVRFSGVAASWAAVAVACLGLGNVGVILGIL